MTKYIIVLILLALSLAACGETTAKSVSGTPSGPSGTLTPNPERTFATPLPTDTPSPTPPPVAAIGQTVTTTDDETYTVVQYKAPIRSGNQFETPEVAGGYYAAAQVQVCAGPHPNSTVYVAGSMFVVVEPDNTQISDTYISPPGYPVLNGGPLPVNQCVRGWIFYDLPPGKPTKIQLENSDISWALP